MVLDRHALRPTFPGSLRAQVGAVLRWLRGEQDRLLARGTPLDHFRLPLPPALPPVPLAPGDTTGGFDRDAAITVWREGLLRAGTRRLRTKKIILLARSLGFYGDELLAFVNAWVAERHQGNSRDVNRALREGDPTLRRVRAENLDLIEGWSAPYFERVPHRLAPLPLDWLRVLADAVLALDLPTRELYATLRFGFEAHALAEYFSWACWGGAPEGPVAATLWQRLHASRHVELRRRLETAGLVRLTEPSHLGTARQRGRAARYAFPLIALEAREARLGLHEGLVTLWEHEEMVERLGTSRARFVRTEAQREGALPRWGTGARARGAVVTRWASLQRRERRAETRRSRA